MAEKYEQIEAEKQAQLKLDRELAMAQALKEQDLKRQAS